MITATLDGIGWAWRNRANLVALAVLWFTVLAYLIR